MMAATIVDLPAYVNPGRKSNFAEPAWWLAPSARDYAGTSPDAGEVRSNQRRGTSMPMLRLPPRG